MHFLKSIRYASGQNIITAMDKLVLIRQFLDLENVMRKGKFYSASLRCFTDYTWGQMSRSWHEPQKFDGNGQNLN